MKNLIKTKWFIFGTYLLLVLATLLIGFVLLQNNSTLRHGLIEFFEVAENRTFDYRQVIQVAHKRPVPNKDIVILAIDDASLESLWDKYGEWPIPRNVYADMINYIEAQKPQAIMFDLMFLKSVRSEADADKSLADAMNKYPNVYTAMNFDSSDSDVRLPIDLPKRLEVNIDNQAKVNLKWDDIKNCRPILASLLNGKVNVGIINIKRKNNIIVRCFKYIFVFMASRHFIMSSTYDLRLNN